MDGESLQQHVRSRVEDLPGAGLEYPFGPDWEVFKVCGRVFMLMTEVAGELIVVSKWIRRTVNLSARSTRASRPAFT